MIPYNYSIPIYYYIPVPADDKGTKLTGPEFVGLITFFVWIIAVAVVAEFLALDIENRVFGDNKQDIKRHTIELIVLLAIGLITLAVVDVVNGG